MTYSQVNNEYVTQVTINFTAWSRELWNSNDYRPYTYGSCDYMSRDEGIRRICMCLTTGWCIRRVAMNHGASNE